MKDVQGLSLGKLDLKRDKLRKERHKAIKTLLMCLEASRWQMEVAVLATSDLFFSH